MAVAGHVHVSLIPTSAMPRLIAHLKEDGFATETPNDFPDARHVILCKRRHCEIALETYPDPKNAGQTFVVVAYPPYSAAPWRWAREHKLFGDLTSHLDRLEAQGD